MLQDSSDGLAKGAGSQASSLEETSASLEEMSSMTKNNAENARQATVLANEAFEAAEQGKWAMDHMSKAIGGIKTSSDKTAKIIKTIDEIAFQTNLLALNAAVEAARAGDAGRGFAVVADEVRSLALRSSEAARNTTTLLQEAQETANKGVAMSEELSTILVRISESVDKVKKVISDVSSGSNEQSLGIEQVNRAVSEVDKVTQSNAANAEESASASSELAAHARELATVVQMLHSLVEGRDDRGPSSASAYPVEQRSHRPAPPPRPKRQAVPQKPPPVKKPDTGAEGTKPPPEKLFPLDDDELAKF
jgi:methyl-accepting chemotaxis protein